jgi:hypothetical protein
MWRGGEGFRFAVEKLWRLRVKQISFGNDRKKDNSKKRVLRCVQDDKFGEFRMTMS